MEQTGQVEMEIIVDVMGLSQDEEFEGMNLNEIINQLLREGLEIAKKEGK